jgi:hypothetical protein
MTVVQWALGNVGKTVGKRMHEESPPRFTLRYHSAVAGLLWPVQGRSSVIACLLFRVPGPFAKVGYTPALISSARATSKRKLVAVKG